MEGAMGYAHRVESAQRVNLAEFDPPEDAGLKRKEAERKTARYIGELIELQELLYAVRLLMEAIWGLASNTAGIYRLEYQPESPACVLQSSTGGWLAG